MALKDQKSKEAEVPASETSYVVSLFNAVQRQGHVSTFEPLGSLIPSKSMESDLLNLDNSKKIDQIMS